MIIFIFILYWFFILHLFILFTRQFTIMVLNFLQATVGSDGWQGFATLQLSRSMNKRGNCCKLPLWVYLILQYTTILLILILTNLTGMCTQPVFYSYKDTQCNLLHRETQSKVKCFKSLSLNTGQLKVRTHE